MTAERVEAGLRKYLSNAQADLDAFLRSKAARFALDSLLPGWQDLDASDLLPHEKCHVFVSNDPDEWIDFLVENGVDRAVATKFVGDYWQGNDG